MFFTLNKFILKSQQKLKMKIAYIFRNNMASTFQLNSMILPQLENKSHGVDVVGMMFLMIIYTF